MEFRTTRIYEENALAWFNRSKGFRRALNEGGTWASKTYSILQILILIAKYTKEPLLISIISESLPHLKRGCIKDFFALLGESPSNNSHYNMSEHIYDFGLGRIEFFPADEAAKLRGGRRDIYFINECNNISYDSFREIDVRTKLFGFLDWNPVSAFWIHENGLISNPENVYIHSTYLDAINVIPSDVVKNILNMGSKDPNWNNVYVLGRVGKVMGLVYPYFEQCDELPIGDTFYGLDFGYSSDPTVLVKNVVLGDNLYSEEFIYEAGLTNDAIAHRMGELNVRKGYDEIWADSSEPKSIDEIKKFNFNIKPCSKGADSVEFGHQKTRQFKQFWTKGSLNCIKEQRNFRYITDKDGNLTQKTTHLYSHGMDARRYGVVGAIVEQSGIAFGFV